MALSDLNDLIDSKVVASEQQSEALEAEIQKKINEQNNYKDMMDKVNIQMVRNSTDATSDTTSVITHTYTLIYDIEDTTGLNEIVLGIPRGYDSTGISGGECYDSTSTDSYFYALGDQLDSFPIDSTQAYHIDSTSNLSFIRINCKEYYQDSSGVNLTVIKCSNVTEEYSNHNKYFHKYGDYYPGTIDATSDMTSWIVFDYMIPNDGSINYGFPTGFDSTSNPQVCYDDSPGSTAKYFYVYGNSTAITTGTRICQEGNSINNIVYITIDCVGSYINDGTTYTVARISNILTGQRGQTSTTFSNPKNLMKQDLWYQGGPNWESSTQIKKDKINKLASDFFYAHDYIWLPIGLSGTYGTKDTISKLQLGKEIQVNNKSKLQGGSSAFKDYI